MVLHSDSKFSTRGWTIFDLLTVMLASAVAALLVSIWFPHRWRPAVLLISYIVFSIFFSASFIFWLIPTVNRRREDKLYDEGRQLFLKGRHNEALVRFKHIYEFDRRYRDISEIVEDSFRLSEDEWRKKFQARFKRVRDTD